MLGPQVVFLSAISIHALVKRATEKHQGGRTGSRNFNPRPREEGDRQRLYRVLSAVYFNPRPREEGDRAYLRLHRRVKNFNPRPREEGDSAVDFGFRVAFYFNPRPREEGDGTKRAVFDRIKNFNPRPREEGDGFSERIRNGVNKFQSTPS